MAATGTRDQRARALVLALLVLAQLPPDALAFKLDAVGRVATDRSLAAPDGRRFEPYETGFVAARGDGRTQGRTHLNEGGQQRSPGVHGKFEPGVKYHAENQTLSFLPGVSRTNQVLRFELEGVAPRQVCPAMVGPEEDGAYYCVDAHHGFCDRRSGICHCFEGYQGLDCTECRPTHVRLADGQCAPKVLCPGDCSGAGECDFETGQCTCLPHRAGEDCSLPFCETLDPLCVTCDREGAKCVRCRAGFFLNASSSACEACTVFDPRCVACTGEAGCSACGDLLLNSVRRSGRRVTDQPLPFDEVDRELSAQFPFGSQALAFFDEAEPFELVRDGTTEHLLADEAVHCTQRDAHRWTCEPVEESHGICGHHGTVAFSSPAYAAVESSDSLEVKIVRTGGGHGHVAVSYRLRHVTTSDADVSASARYTSARELVFFPGVVQLTFRVALHDDYELEDSETFDLELFDAREPHTGRAIPLGPQRVTRVTILDDDFWVADTRASRVDASPFAAMQAGQDTVFQVQTRTPTGLNRTEALALGQQLVAFKSEPGAALLALDTSERAFTCLHQSDGVYACSVPADDARLTETHVAFARPGGLQGYYYDDALALSADIWPAASFPAAQAPMTRRVDREINFMWGSGQIVPGAADFVSVRWSGGVALPADLVAADPSARLATFQILADDNARLFVDGKLVVSQWDREPAGSALLGSALLVPGRVHTIVLDYRELRGDAHVRLLWNLANATGGSFETVPSTSLFLLEPLQGSPFAGVVAPAPVAASRSFVSGACAEEATAGWPCTFDINPRDAFGNLQMNLHEGASWEALAVLAVPGSPGNFMMAPSLVTGTIYPVPDAGVFRVDYTPFAAGASLLVITVGGIDLAGTPLDLHVRTGEAHGPTSELHGTGVDPSAGHVAGSNETLTITVRDGHGNLVVDRDMTALLSVALVHTETPHESYSATIAPTGADAEYVATYMVERSGTLTLLATLGCVQTSSEHSLAGAEDRSVPCEHIGESPITLQFGHSNIDAAQTLASGPGLSAATSGVAALFTVHARDPFGNRVMDTPADVDFGARLTFEDGTEEAFGAGTCVRAAGIDTYACSYTPARATIGEEAAVLEIIRLDNGERIFGGFGFRVLVADGACSAAQSRALGDGAENAVAGQLARFTVQTADAAGNVRDGPCLSGSFDVQPPEAQGVVTHLNEGTYEVVYNATQAGVLNLRVRFDGTDIGNSPLAIVVRPAAAHFGTSVASGAGIVAGTVGEQQEVHVQASDRFANALTDDEADFQAQLFHNDVLLFTQDSTYLGGGLYDLSIVPTLAQKSGESRLVVRLAESGGVDASYFSRSTQTADSLAVEAVDPSLDMDWSFPAAHAIANRGVGWSARWTGLIKLPPAPREVPSRMDTDAGLVASSDLRVAFRLRIAGGGARFWVHGSLMADEVPLPKSDLSEWRELDEPLAPGKLLSFQLDYFKDTRAEDGRLTVEWAVMLDRGGALGRGGKEKLDAHFAPVPPQALRRWRTVSEHLPVYSPAVAAAKQSLVVDVAPLSSLVSGVVTTFQVAVRDRFGNANLGHSDRVVVLGWHVDEQLDRLEANPQAPGLEGVVTAVPGADGLFTVTVTPSQAGPFLLFVAVNPPDVHEDLGRAEQIEELYERSVAGSPFEVQVQAGACDSVQSSAFGTNVASAEAGKPSHFMVQARDAAGNNCPSSGAVQTVTWTSPAGVEGDAQWSLEGVEYLEDGLFRVAYSVTKSGDWSVSVLMSDGNLLAPITVSVEPTEAHGPSSSAQAVAVDDGQPGFAFDISVEARDRFGNALQRGGDDFIFKLHIPDKFTPLFTTGEDEAVSAAMLERFEKDAPWADYVREVVDGGNGTHVARLELDAGFAGDMLKLSVALAHGAVTPDTTACSDAFPAVCDTRTPPLGGGLLGTYFTGPPQASPPLRARIDATIDFAFTGSMLQDALAVAPSADRPSLPWQAGSSAAWHGYVKAEHSGDYQFMVEGVNGTQHSAKLVVAGNVLVPTGDSIFLRGGRLYEIELHFTQVQHEARIALRWCAALGATAASDEPSELLAGTVSVTQHSFAFTTSENLTATLGAGDWVRVGDQTLFVEHYDTERLAARTREPYEGATDSSAQIWRRPRCAVVPSSNLFHSAAALGNSPLLLTLPAHGP